MNRLMDEFISKFKTQELLIYETDYWCWSLRPAQATLGASILSLKRECTAFSELNQAEFSDLNNIIKIIEKTLKLVFEYDVINYLMLMMVDKHVHYHVLPRYQRTVDFNGLTWKDAGWPGLPNLSGDELDISVLNQISDEIKARLVN